LQRITSNVTERHVSMQRKILITLALVLVGLMAANAAAQLTQSTGCESEGCCCPTKGAASHDGRPSACCQTEAACCDFWPEQSAPNAGLATLPHHFNLWSPSIDVDSVGAVVDRPGLCQAHWPRLQCALPISDIPIYLRNLSILC
jgi:hypothetical protein